MHEFLGIITDDVRYQSALDECSPTEADSEISDRSASTEADDAGGNRRPCVSFPAFGFRGKFVDLGDLVRCPALGIIHNGCVPTFVTCKDAIAALCQLPGTISAKIRELGVPDQLMAADDYDSRDYVEALGQDLVEATANMKVITLSVPDDISSGRSGGRGLLQ